MKEWAQPRLRDQYGQPWAWPPLAPAGEQADGFLLPDGGSLAARCWIAFLPGAFTPVCTHELGWMSSLAGKLSRQDVALRIVSCDPAPVLRAVADGMGISIPLLSDFWPHGAAAQLLGSSTPSQAAHAALASWSMWTEPCWGASRPPRVRSARSTPT